MLPRMSQSSDLVESVEHYPNGGVKFRGVLLEGEMHGDWTWFRADGSVMRTGQFDHGRQVGPWRTFARDGRLVKETDFGPAEPAPGSGSG